MLTVNTPFGQLGPLSSGVCASASEGQATMPIVRNSAPSLIDFLASYPGLGPSSDFPFYQSQDLE
jgi:hypothetical protein